MNDTPILKEVLTLPKRHEIAMLTALRIAIKEVKAGELQHVFVLTVDHDKSFTVRSHGNLDHFTEIALLSIALKSALSHADVTSFTEEDIDDDSNDEDDSEDEQEDED